MKKTKLSVDIYNSLTQEERKIHELEIRYSNNSLSFELIENIIKIGIKNFKAKEIKFIDSLNYTNKFKIGSRTLVENNKTTSIEFFKKENIVSNDKMNLVGKFSINLSKEINIQKEELPTILSIVLLKRRFQFIHNENKDWRFDISIIRKSEPTPTCIQMAFKEFFIDINDVDTLLKLIKNRSLIHSSKLEIEYIGNKNVDINTIEKISLLGFLISDPEIGNIIKYKQEIIQLSNIINKKKENIYNKKIYNNITLNQVLPPVKTITKQQYFEIFPPVNYLLKEKVNGNRLLVYIKDDIAVFIKDNKTIDYYDIPKYNKKILVECEEVEDKINVFDILIYNDIELLDKGIETRIINLKDCCILLNKFIKKNFIPANYLSLSNTLRYKTQFHDKYENSPFPVDGLILVEKEKPYINSVIYKWKPWELQTIDFLCKRCPEHLIKKGNYPTKDNHQLYILYCTSSRQLIKNLRITNNYGYNELFDILQDYDNIPVPFVTPLVPLGYIYYRPDDEDDIDDLICEFSCHKDCIIRDEIHNRFFINWRFIKKRHDKNVIPGVSYGNNYATAFYSFLNHINIFDISYLYNGTPEDQYYQNSGGENNTYSGIRYLSNYIKSQLISENAQNNVSVLDIGSGRGGDLYKYIQQNLVKNLIVLDKDKTSLTELFSRWLDISKKSRVVLKTILRGIITDINDPFKENVYKIRSLINCTYFNSIFCHSTIHYFCESVESVRNFVSFCNNMTTVNSKVVITCPNGELIFKLLQNATSWDSIENDTVKYRIEKHYIDNVMTDAGQKISVLLPFTKGKTYMEYLVNSRFLINTFKEQGFSLLYKKSYKNYLDGFKVYKEEKYNILSEKDIEWINLYQSLVFKKL